jgi:hypothetical protein
MSVSRTPEGYWGEPWTQEEIKYLQDNYTTKKAKDIAEYLGRSYQAVLMKASLIGLKSHHRTGVNSLTKDYFHVIDTPMKAYILGLLTADGSVSNAGQVTLALHEKDRSLVEAVRNELAPGARITRYCTRTTPMVRFSVSSPEVVTDLARHGVIPIKTLRTRWPLELPEQFEKSYLCGYFDGDGSLHQDPPRWSITGGNPDFLNTIQERVRVQTGIRIGGPYRDRRHEHAWSIVATGGPVRALDTWLHQDVPGLARKTFSYKE